jgi:hypothetical protein
MVFVVTDGGRLDMIAKLAGGSRVAWRIAGYTRADGRATLHDWAPD